MKTNIKRIAFGVCAVCVLTGVGVIRAVGPEPTIVIRDPHGENYLEWAVQDKKQAIAKVRAILGLSGRGDLSVDARVVFLAEDNTPFLSGQVIGRPVWHVVISDWKLQLKSVPPDVEDLYARTFDIFLGAEDGRLFKIVSRWPEGVPRIPPEPGPASYTNQMRLSGIERYYGFPDESPPVKFLDALDTVLRDGGNTLGAEQIVGQYVIWSRMGRESKPVWVITLRDTEPFWEPSFPGVGVNARNHMRHLVDAQTGKWLCANTTPQPTTLDGKQTKRVGGEESRSVQRDDEAHAGAVSPSGEPPR